MRKFGLLHPLVLSFYSRPLYQDVGKNWRGAAFLYLLLLVGLCWLPVMVQMQVDVAHFVEEGAMGFVQQVPRISISDGVVSTDVETPYYIRDPETGRPLIIIDLTGEFTSLEGTEAKALITTKQLVMQRNERETRIYDLSGIKSFAVDRSRIEHWLQLARSWLVLVLFPIILFFSYCYRVFQTFIYGLIGLIFGKMSHVPLGLMASMRIAIIAITPPLILDAVLKLAKVHLPLSWLIGFVIAMIYLYFGIRANAAEQPQGSTQGQG